MSISSIISNLQQAKDCAGKCDCCNKLQQQINALNQKINSIESNYLSKNEKSEIIQSAYYQSVQWAEPKFALVNSEIDGWQLVLQAISASLVLINQFLKEIKQAADSFANWVRAEFPKLQSYVNEEIRKIYQEINRNKPRNYDSDIAELRRLLNEVSGTATSAEREAKDVRTIAEKAYELAQATNNELLKFKDSMRSALESLRVELKADIAYVTERALAAMQRLEAFIKFELAFLTSSTLNAMLRLQTRIGRNESMIKDAQNKADKAIRNANLAINDIKAIKPNVETALDKATLAIKDSAKAIELGDINSLKTIDLRIRLGAIPQQIKDEIIPKIPPVAEEYARKYAAGNKIDMGEIQRGYNYSEDTKLDRLQKQLDAKWSASLREADLQSNGG
jgi:cell division septum initiation protein DivIVA